MVSEDAFDLSDCVGMLESLVSMTNDEFGFRTIEVAAGVSNYPVAATMCRRTLKVYQQRSK